MINKTWPTKKLGELLMANDTGIWGDPIHNDEKGILILRSTNFDNDGSLNFSKIAKRKIPKNKIEDLYLQNGDILLEKSGGGPEQPVGRVSYFVAPDNQIYVFANFIQRLRPNQDVINSRFLFHCLFYLYKIGTTLRLQSQTTGIRNLNLNLYLKIKIPTPSLHMQHQIVERLDAIKKAQELNDKQIALADELFQSLLNTELDTKEKNWEIKKLKDITTRVSKGESPNWQGVSYTNDGVLFIRSENVLNGNLDFTNTIRIPIAFHKKLKRSQVSTGDILLNIVGASIGRAAIFSGTEVEANVNQAVSVISTNNKIVSSKFILYYMLTEYFQRQIELRKVEGARANISLTDIGNFIVPLPSIESQRQIVEKLQAVQDFKNKFLEQKQKLQELFESCLDKAMKGQLVK